MPYHCKPIYNLGNINPGNEYGETPIHSAAANGHLVNSKAQKKTINHINNFDETPLHSAAARGQLNSKSQKKSPGDDYGESHSKFPVSQLTSLRILTLNVCGFKSHVHIDQVRNSHVKNKVDVAVLTETEISHDTFNIDG